MDAPSAGPRAELVSAFRAGFPDGFSPVTKEGETGLDMGIDFGIQKMAADVVIEECHSKETVWVLLRGTVELEFDGRMETVERGSLFDEPATALHLGRDTAVKISTVTEAEWAVARTENPARFSPRLFRPSDISVDQQGKGLAQDACVHTVRRIFDRGVRKNSNLAIGEIINHPGRWSSYPPRRQRRPAVHHYRFSQPSGYGLADCGDDVFKLKACDTVKVPGGVEHSQVSAPRYGMYDLWIVGHPAAAFEDAPEHPWVNDPDRQGWRSG